MSVLAIGGAAVLGGFLGFRHRIREVFAGLVEWEGKRGKLTVGSPSGLAVLGSMTALSLYFVGLGLGLGGGVDTAGSQSDGFAYGAPNTPTATAVVVDTSTVYVQGSAFVGSGDDTQDSIRVAITRVAADTTAIIAETLGGAQTRDTVVSNDSLKADTTYKAWLKYKGAAAKSALWSAWSAPDTFVNTVASAAGLVLSNQWDSIGTSQYAKRDSANSIPLRQVYGNGRTSEVVTASSLSLSGWPTTNVYRAIFEAGSPPRSEAYGFLATNSPIPTLTAGQDLFYRWYFRCSADDADDFSSDPNFHPIEDGSGGGSSANWAFRPAVRQTGVCEADFRALEASSPNMTLMNGPDLAKDSIWRMEVNIHIVAVSTVDSMQMHVRIYDANNTLRFDDGDICGAVCLDTNPVLAMHADGVGDLRGFKIGVNDGNLSFASTTPVFDYGALCIRTNTWCGEYSAGVEAGGP